MGAARAVEVGDRRIGAGAPCFVIAEAGVNHNGDPVLASRMVRAAAEARADAVKFQTFSTERLVTRDAPLAAYQRRGAGDAAGQFALLHRLELPEAAHRKLIAECSGSDIIFLSSVFDEASADLLTALGVPAFKIPSGELTNLPLLEHIARKGKPMIVSTGMATMEEVGHAVEACAQAGNRELVLLHCVSSYPADAADANLRVMRTMAEAFSLPVGFSDHTLGTTVALAAVALGAAVLEKHFTLDRQLPGPDHQASLEPKELQALVAGIREVERSLGDGVKHPVQAEAGVAMVARKSLVAAVDIAKGTVITADIIAVRRPGTGLPPSARADVLGRRAREDIPAGTLLTREMLE